MTAAIETTPFPLISRIGHAFRSILRRLLPGIDGASNGFAAGLAIAAVLYSGFTGFIHFTGLGWLADSLGSGLIMLFSLGSLGGLAAMLYWGLGKGLKALSRRLPRWIGWLPAILALPFSFLPLLFVGVMAAVGFIMLAASLWPESWIKLLSTQGPAQFVLVGEAIVGAVIGATWGWKARRWVKMVVLGLAIFLHLAAATFALFPGSDDYLARPAAVPPGTQLSLPDPGQPGPYAVHAYSYGSGSDLHRPEYAQNASWRTPTVGVSAAFWKLTGFDADYNRWFWGFDWTQMPLNALVWAPEGAGPFPLVLIVHGNHAMGHFSESGYTYLGQHLASQGFILASVDENFLNGSWAGGLNTEYPIRAWLLLQHLEQWTQWNADPTNPLYGKVDLSRIALVGHSRGGQAVALAAAMNQLGSVYVEGLPEPVETDFAIKAVVSIAPNEGDYNPGGSEAALKGINYMLLQGGHDADCTTAQGIRQYQRVSFEPGDDAFKTIVYPYRANHGLFNTVWQYGDAGMLMGWTLNLKPLLSPSEQQQTAKVFITAFLKAALNGESAYRQLFQSPWSGQAWLPRDIVATKYMDATFLPVQTFHSILSETDVDVDGAVVTGANLALWKVQVLDMRDNQESQRIYAAHLRWEPGAAAQYSIQLPPTQAAAWQLDDTARLTFGLGPAEAGQNSLDLSVELADARGASVSLPLSSLAPIEPALVSRLAKSDELIKSISPGLALANAFERIPQVYSLPLSDFRQANPQFDPSRLVSITLRFDRSPSGNIYLENIGFFKP